MAEKPIKNHEYDGSGRKSPSPGLIDIPVKHQSSLSTGKVESSPGSFDKSSKPLRDNSGGGNC